jgi:predicted nucleic acid-binding Zn finger protein
MTLDEARLMANVNDRAQRLFEDGYRARWNRTGRLEVRSGKGASYLVDTEAGTCDCPFYRAHQGRHLCKHSLGWRRLLSKQRACRRLVLLVLLKAWADLDDRGCVRIAEAAPHD